MSTENGSGRRALCPDPKTEVDKRVASEVRKREIGSEFAWSEHTGAQTTAAWMRLGEDRCLVFSGRTAIEHVLDDARIKGRALLPSYCCGSMLQPFLDRGISVDFYPVFFGDGLELRCQVPEDCKLLFYCNYFGFHTPFFSRETLERIRRNGGVIVEDITHSLLSENVMHTESDYAVASLRKWFPVLSGGLSVKTRGRFHRSPCLDPEPEFVRLRMRAMREKRAYVDAGYCGDKQSFLRQYAEANRWLAEHYSDRRIDADSGARLRTMDYRAVREQRIRNGNALYSALQDQNAVRFLFRQEQMDCPLFVPVILDRSVRDRIRDMLVAESVYCPIHWPIPDASCASNLYVMELSLVCDQRYQEADMQRIAACLLKCCQAVDVLTDLWDGDYNPGYTCIR